MSIIMNNYTFCTFLKIIYIYISLISLYFYIMYFALKCRDAQIKNRRINRRIIKVLSKSSRIIIREKEVLCGSKVNCAKLGGRDRAIISEKKRRKETFIIKRKCGVTRGPQLFPAPSFLRVDRPVFFVPNNETIMCARFLSRLLFASSFEAHNDSARDRNLASGRSLIPSV